MSSRRWRPVLVATLLVAGLLAPAAATANDGSPPTCTDANVSTDEDTPLSNSVTCTDQDSFTYAVDTKPAHGGVELDSNSGAYTYTPDPDYNGPDFFTFVGIDPVDGQTPTPAQVSISVDSVNDAPSFTKGPDDSVAENSGTRTVAGWATNIDEGAQNESGQTLTFEITDNTDPSLFATQPAVSSTGTLTYKPATSQVGTATITLDLKDSGGTANGGQDTSATQSFDITITNVNDPPVAVGDSRATNEDTTLVVAAPGVLSNDSDPDGDPLTAVLNADVTNGTLTLNSNGGFTYAPDANYHGQDSFTYHAKDTSNASSNVVTVSLAVTSVNDLPVCADGSTSTTEDTPVTDTVSCSDVDGNSLTYSVSAQGTGGTASFGSGATFTYTPDANFSGTDSFDFRANDGFGFSSSATETVTVTGTNDPPSFTKGGNQTVLEDAGAQTVSAWASAISPGPGETGSVTFVIDSTNPDLFSSGPAVASNGTLTYTPTPNANGTSTVTLHAEDNGGAISPTQTFTITITPVNDPPSFTKGANQTVTEDSGAHSVPGWATGIVKGPTADESTQTVDFVIDSNSDPALFSVAPAVSPAGALSYTLAPNAHGTATIGLHIHDNGGIANGGDDASNTTTFTITVTNVNDAPTCANTGDATFVNAVLNSSITSCSDIDGDNLSYALVTQPPHGTASVNSNGTFTYTPNASFQGTDTFTFKAHDAALDSNTATMSILVSPDPIARNDVSPTDFPPIVQGSGPTAIPVLANDVDKQGGPLLIIAVTQGSKGKVAITGGGTGLTYDPTGLVIGTDSFRYTIKDNQNRTNSAIVVVVIVRDTIKPVATVPHITLVSPATLGSTGAVRISWTATDIGTGLKAIQLQESYNGGTFRTVTLASPRATSVRRSFVFFRTYRYRVRATDVAGNIGVYVYSPTFLVGRYQESSGAIAYSGDWPVGSSSSFSAGKARWATGRGASATFTFTGGGFAWVSAKGPSRGAAQVYVDGVLLTTVNLYRSTTLYRQVVFSERWSSVGPHTVRIVDLRTTGHPRIDVDAFLVQR